MRTASGIFLPPVPQQRPWRGGGRAKRMSLCMGLGAVIEADGTVASQDSEWTFNGLHDAGEQSMLNVYLREQANVTKFLGLLNNSFTVAAATDTFTTNAVHGMAVGDVVNIGPLVGAAPLVNGSTYFVKTVPLTTTFTVSTTSGGVVLDITADGSGGYLTEKMGTMTAVNEMTATGTNGYARQQILSTDWVDDGLILGDARFSAAEKNFGPATGAAQTATHSSLSTTATGAGVLLATLALSATTTIAVSQSFRYLLRVSLG